MKASALICGPVKDEGVSKEPCDTDTGSNSTTTGFWTVMGVICLLPTELRSISVWKKISQTLLFLVIAVNKPDCGGYNSSYLVLLAQQDSSLQVNITHMLTSA